MPKAMPVPMTQATPPAPKPMPPTYEAALQELEHLVSQLESGDCRWRR
jgi:exonuclease VII small subunit